MQDSLKLFSDMGSSKKVCMNFLPSVNTCSDEMAASQPVHTDGEVIMASAKVYIELGCKLFVHPLYSLKNELASHKHMEILLDTTANSVMLIEYCT